MRFEVRTTTLPLRRRFAIARGSTDEARLLHVRLEQDGFVGWGEAAASPSVTGESHAQARAALEAIRPDALEPEEPTRSLGSFTGLGPAARAALEMALLDLQGKREGRNVREAFGLPEKDLHTFATVTLTDPASAGQEAARWAAQGYTHLKVKLDASGHALECVQAVAEAAPQAAIGVDANEALDPAGALELVSGLADLGVVFIEQPLPRDDLAGLRRLAATSDLPILLDETIRGPGDVAAIEDLEGPVAVNVKVQKVGGLAPALACIDEARRQGRDVLVGCNLESGLGIAAGAALLGRARWADLDGNLFLGSDPFPLPRPGPGWVGTLEGPGLGVTPDPRLVDPSPTAQG